jgi:apolipoprotein D and lipocalin family protein
MQVAANVDLERFMGDWYVIASIPTFMEKGVLNPIERYSLNPDGTIDTTFSFNSAADGSLRQLKAKGFISDTNSNAVWGMQFLWPIKADYRIAYIDVDYQHTIIARKRRDYLWIMSREPQLTDSTLAELLEIAVGLGYERSKIHLTNWQQVVPRGGPGLPQSAS